VNGADYLIPLSVVDKCYELTSLDQLNDFNNLAYFNGQQIPFISLSQVLNCNETPSACREMVVVYHEEKRIGLIVDHVVGKFQAVLKSLGQYFMNINTISGATILGSGNIALVLDTNKVIEQYLAQKPVHLCQ
jgi:two-component system chemotaxis sensor kinase CheA